LRPEPGVTLAWLRDELRARAERSWREMVVADLIVALFQSSGSTRPGASSTSRLGPRWTFARWDAGFGAWCQARDSWEAELDSYLLSLGKLRRLRPGVVEVIRCHSLPHPAARRKR
jgi:hypothetical protein